MRRIITTPKAAAAADSPCRDSATRAEGRSAREEAEAEQEPHPSDPLRLEDCLGERGGRSDPSGSPTGQPGGKRGRERSGPDRDHGWQRAYDQRRGLGADPTTLEGVEERRRKQDAGRDPRHPCDDRDDQCLPDQECPDLPRLRADRAKKRELAAALQRGQPERGGEDEDRQHRRDASEGSTEGHELLVLQRGGGIPPRRGRFR